MKFKGHTFTYHSCTHHYFITHVHTSLMYTQDVYKLRLKDVGIIHGYCIYQEVWDEAVGKLLWHELEQGNTLHNSYINYGQN